MSILRDEKLAEAASNIAYELDINEEELLGYLDDNFGQMIDKVAEYEEDILERY